MLLRSLLVAVAISIPIACQADNSSVAGAMTLEKISEHRQAAERLESSARSTSNNDSAAGHWLSAGSEYDKLGDYQSEARVLDLAYNAAMKSDYFPRYQVQSALIKFYASRDKTRATAMAKEILAEKEGEDPPFEAWGYGLSCVTAAVALESTGVVDLTRELYRTGFNTALSDLDARMPWLADYFERAIEFAASLEDKKLEGMLRSRREANLAAWSSPGGTPERGLPVTVSYPRAYKQRATIYTEYGEKELAAFATEEAELIADPLK